MGEAIERFDAAMIEMRRNGANGMGVSQLKERKKKRGSRSSAWISGVGSDQQGAIL